MYDIFVDLMEKKGVTAYKVAQATGITNATLSRWKTGRVSPSIETLSLLAEYFKVSVDYLLGKEKSPSAPEVADEPIIIRRLSKGVSKMTPEQHEKMIKILNASFDDLFMEDK